ncbi:MAG TPA: redox-regulated ATPase YchF [Methylomirabilota bacterium]|nr:redox-regulated ATPase YchF [Methylomirabilota bacterium]
MQTGIIGLPLVGKTTLFRILTRAKLDAKSAHGVTHVGVARVPEPRLERLAELYKPKKITHASVEYVDVGGMQKDRVRDSAVLAPLREVEALAHVLRAFDDPAVPHTAGSIDPLRDAISLDLELMLSDLEQITRRLDRLEKDIKKKKDPVLEHEFALLTRCRLAIESEHPLRELEVTPDEQKMLSSFMFLSQRPMLYVVNVGDAEVADLDSVAEKHGLTQLRGRKKAATLAVCGKIEAELAELEGDEAAELLAAYGLKESGLDRLIHATYELLGLTSFFTAAEPEVRAWTIRRGTTAHKAAGVIHSDFERGFIRAEVVRCDELLAAGSVAAAREKGHVRLEGKEYIVQEGDVILFRHSG